MKILIVSKFFYARGGAEVVAIGTRRMLQERGHDVRVFAMAHPENLDIPDASGYAKQVSFDGGCVAKIHGARRTLGRGNVVQAARKVLDDFRPDVVHLHNVHSYLSPLVGEMAHQRGAGVVWTLHDYKLVCPAYAFRRPDGTICQECLQDRHALMRYRCMKGSLCGSLLARMEADTWHKARLSAFTDYFITPSSFMGNKMREGGFESEKVKTICNFVDPPKLATLQTMPVKQTGDGYFCYIGRLSDEKGVTTLLKAADKAGVKLKLAGDGPLFEPLQREYANNRRIEFLGKKDAPGVARLLNGADASVISSEWYENNPLSVIESLCAGTPVIGAEIGGIPELISSDNGILYRSGDAEALTKILATFVERKYSREAIAAKARIDFCEETHYKKLLALYQAAKQ